MKDRAPRAPITLETAVGDGKLTQSFDPESFKRGDPFTNWECASPRLNDSESKSYITLPSRTAVSRIIPKDPNGCPFLILAPMEGVGDRCFRRAMASVGGFDEAVTDFLRVPTHGHVQSLARAYESQETAPIPRSEEHTSELQSQR